MLSEKCSQLGRDNCSEEVKQQLSFTLNETLNSRPNKLGSCIEYANNPFSNLLFQTNVC